MLCFSLHFDIGYVKGSSKICFSQSDDIKMELKIKNMDTACGVKGSMFHKSDLLLCQKTTVLF